MSINSPIGRVAGLIAVTLVAGCQVDNYRWQTVVHEDGSVTRSISQPRDETPADALQQAHWQKFGFHDALSRSDWPERFTESRFELAKPADADDGPACLIAEGTFAALEDVPDHYRYELEGTELASVLMHELTIHDFGLVKEYVWSEIVTDVVRFEEIPAARREMIDLFANMIEEGLHNGLGEDYDISPLIAWIRTDGEKMLEEVTLLTLSPDIKNLNDEGAQHRLLKILSAYGWKELTNEGFEDFVRLRLKAGIRRKDGKPVEDRLIEALLKDPPAEDGKERPNPYQAALQQAYDKHFGDGGLHEHRLWELIARQFGIYSASILKTPYEFDIWLKLPGEVIETNGTLEEQGFLKWSFTDSDIRLTGYQMTARSVLPVRVRNSNVLRREQLGSRDEMLTFLRLIKSDQELQDTFNTCRKENSLEPLKQLIDVRHQAAIAKQNDIVEGRARRSEWLSAKQLLEFLNQDLPAATN